MFQSLVQDRFNLKFHWVTRELPLYTIAIARGVPKLTEWKERSKPWIVNNRPVREGLVLNHATRDDRHHIVGHKVPVSALAAYFADGFQRVLLDKTGLTFDYDIEEPRPPRAGRKITPFAGSGEISGAPSRTLMCACGTRRK
jgi:uncharacterized protein (TIGR03435 family)